MFPFQDVDIIQCLGKCWSHRSATNLPIIFVFVGETVCVQDKMRHLHDIIDGQRTNLMIFQVFLQESSQGIQSSWTWYRGIEIGHIINDEECSAL